MHGEAWVNEAIQSSDLLLALGARFDDRSVGNARGYAPRARRIHLDIDPAEIGKVVRVDVGLVGDVGRLLRALLPLVGRGGRGGWLGEIAAARAAAGSRDILNLPDDGRLHAAHVMVELRKQTGGKAVVVTDVGQHQMWEAQYYRHERPRSLITSGGLGAMGFGLPAAIGAKMARPDEEVWVIAGDGGFQMTAAELSTVAQEALPLRIAVINNGYLGMVRQWQELFYGRRYAATPMRGPDFCKLADAHGIPACRVESRGRGGRSDRGRAPDGGPRARRVSRGAGGRRLPDGAGRGEPRRDAAPAAARPAAPRRPRGKGGLSDAAHVRRAPARGAGRPHPDRVALPAPRVRRRVADARADGECRASRASRLCVDTDRAGARRLVTNLARLVDVVRVEDVTDRPVVVRDLAMIKVSASAESRADIMQLVQVFRARVVDVAADSLVIETTGTDDKVDGLLQVLRPFGVIEVVRTGRVAMCRGTLGSGTGDGAARAEGQA